MQLEALKIYSDVVRLRSFSRGAEANNVLQSAASQTINNLERHLGVSLIDRSRRPFELTPQGKLFYEGCRDLLQGYTDLENAVRQVQNDLNSVVRVAAIYSVGLSDMSRYVQRFSQSHPQARVQVEYLHPDRVYERVLEDAVDFGIVSFPQQRKEVTIVPWRAERMMVVFPTGHRFAKHAAVWPADLAGEKFVAFDKNLVIRRQIDRLLRRSGARVDVVMEFDNIEAIKRAVEVGAGVAILPEPTLAREVALRTLGAARLNGEEFTRPLGIVHRRGKRFYTNTREFLDLLLKNGKGTH
jgi:DNA-binding transcriptional LysR family regulator